MAEFKATGLDAGKPPVSPVGAAAVVTVLAMVAVTDALAADDLIKALKMPVGCKLVDLEVQSTDIDTDGSPTVVLDFGIFNAAGTDLGTVLINDSAIGQAGGDDVLDAATLDNLVALAADQDTELYIGAKVVTAAATKAEGTIYFKASYIAE